MTKEKQIKEMAMHCFYFVENGYCCADLHKSVMCEDESKTCALYQTLENLYIAGYRKQSENVIELPCKVGDTMYVQYKGIAYPVKVDAIRIDTKKNNHRICVSGTFRLYERYDHDYKATFPFNSVGKSLFYIEAEAMKGGE